MKPAMARLELDRQDLCALLERTRQALSEEDYQKLKAAIATLAYLTQLLERKNMSIQRLRQILFGSSTEKTSKVLKNKPDEHDGDRANAGTNLAGGSGSGRTVLGWLDGRGSGIVG